MSVTKEQRLFNPSQAPRKEPAFQPKLRVRVGSDRTRQVAEFLVDIPAEGYSGEAWEKTVAQLHKVFEKLGLLKERPAAPIEVAGGADSPNAP